MTVGALLLRGMLVGVVAGLLMFALGRIAGEPAVNRAIGFEEAAHEATVKADLARGLPPPVEEPVIVSRAVQRGIGLFTGVAVYAAAIGGLFALVFACANGRIGRLGPREVAALLALCGFIAVYLVPTLKYPANPPAVGAEATIGLRTALYFGMLLISVVAMVAAALLRQHLLPRTGGWPASLWAGLFYLIIVAIGAASLPPIDEVPGGFPADLLWNFRVVALGMQAVLWATLGLGFGWLVERETAGVVCQRRFGHE